MPGSDQLTLWPNHFKPLPDELLGSWIIRLGHAHGYKAERISEMFVGRDKSLWTRDVDKWASAELRQALANATAASEAQIAASTLRAYEGYVSGTVTLNGRSRWIAPTTVRHRVRLRSGLACCSLCLAGDREPYYRRAWRLSFNTVCIHHQVELIDRCPRCESLLMPHRIDIGRDGYAPRRGLLSLCSSCGTDLRRPVPQRADEDVVAWNRLMLGAVSRGHLPWLGKQDLHSVLFFDGIRPIVAGIVTKVLRLSGDFDMLSVSQRRLAMGAVSKVFSKQEQDPARYAHQQGLRFIDVAGSERLRPAWLNVAFESLRPERQPQHSRQEIDAIAAALVAKVGHVSGALAKKHFGARPADRRFPGYFSKAVSDEAYEQLLVSLDHAISASFDTKMRLALLQDKLTFSLVRVMHVSAGTLAALTVEDALNMLPRNGRLRHPGFQPVPIRPEQVRDHLWWHAAKVRPQIDGATSSKSFFVSCYTGRPMGKTAICNRFTTAVQAASLTSAIPSLDALRRHPVNSKGRLT